MTSRSICLTQPLYVTAGGFVEDVELGKTGTGIHLFFSLGIDGLGH